MLGWIIAAVLLLVVVLVVVITTRPDEFRVTRSAQVSAPAATVFPLVNNLRNWENWSPWAKLDPNATMTFSGPDAGEGAHCTWDGNAKVGAGSQTITESKQEELVRIHLQFVKPMKGESETLITFAPEGDSTLVTWSMYGKNNFIGKAIGLFMNCEKMMGEQLQECLRNLDDHVKQQPASAADSQPLS